MMTDPATTVPDTTVPAAPPTGAPGPAAAGLPDAGPAAPADGTPEAPVPGAAARRSIEVLHGVEMVVTVELGRTRLALRDLLDLHPGSVVELDRAAGSPVDVLVNGTLLARGEVVVIDDELGVRVTEVVGSVAERDGS